MTCYDFVSQHAVNLFLERLRSMRICDDSVRIRTDTTLDQDCVLKATAQVCTACMIVSLLTTCLNLNILVKKTLKTEKEKKKIDKKKRHRKHLKTHFLRVRVGCVCGSGCVCGCVRVGVWL